MGVGGASGGGRRATGLTIDDDLVGSGLSERRSRVYVEGEGEVAQMSASRESSVRRSRRLSIKV